MRPIVIRAAGADEIARAWGDLRRVDRQRKGTEVLLDVSALTEASAAFEAFVVALDRREVTVKAIDPNGVIAPIRARYDFASYSGEAVDGAESEYGCFSSAAAAVGRYVCGLWQGFCDSAAFLGETAVWAVGMLRHPGMFSQNTSLTFRTRIQWAICRK